jgi:hypothetical protein
LLIVWDTRGRKNGIVWRGMSFCWDGRGKFYYPGGLCLGGSMSVVLGWFEGLGVPKGSWSCDSCVICTLAVLGFSGLAYHTATHTPSGPKSQPSKKDTTLSDKLMETFKDHTLHELCKLQKKHVKYTRMNEELHLLSIKHQRSFKALTKYLGQSQTCQKKSTSHKFQSSGKTAQNEFHQSRVQFFPLMFKKITNCVF